MIAAFNALERPDLFAFGRRTLGRRFVYDRFFLPLGRGDHILGIRQQDATRLLGHQPLELLSTTNWRDAKILNRRGLESTEKIHPATTDCFDQLRRGQGIRRALANNFPQRGFGTFGGRQPTHGGASRFG